ncbi:hypothetical protein C0Q70_13838 [Pomacea canaliculata]|uniref:Tetraspanin n=1 Tax=Pomacea canaliculata TaxID=400727 RepID=A0A2T7NYC7_POMCA|nr:hypothetical protein C0Q70_13838 [Pomacea canaliculata]
MGGRCCTMSHAGRARLSSFATVHNLLTSFAGKVLVSWALFIKFGLESRVSPVLNNKGGALSYYLMALGSLIFFVQLVAIKAMEVIMVILHISGAILCIVHIKLVKDAFHTGVIAGIKLYRDKIDMKQAIDKIQLSFRCCGASSMEDWFKNSWVSLTYLNVKHPDVEKYLQNGEFIKDDAPFSCCDMTAPRPCVHHDVLNVSAHRFVGTRGTLYTEGCSYALITFWKTYVIYPTFVALIILIFMHLVSIILARLLQTSLDGALDADDPLGEGVAYCCYRSPCSILPSGDPSKVMAKKAAAAETSTEETDYTQDSFSSAATDSRGGDFADQWETQHPTGREPRERNSSRERTRQNDRREGKKKKGKKGKRDKRDKRGKKKGKKKKKPKRKKKKKKPRKMKKPKRPKKFKSKKTRRR